MEHPKFLDTFLLGVACINVFILMSPQHFTGLLNHVVDVFLQKSI